MELENFLFCVLALFFPTGENNYYLIIQHVTVSVVFPGRHKKICCFFFLLEKLDLGKGKLAPKAEAGDVGSAMPQSKAVGQNHHSHKFNLK